MAVFLLLALLAAIVALGVAVNRCPLVRAIACQVDQVAAKERWGD